MVLCAEQLILNSQKNEILCKIIAYNITVLIHEMIHLNGTSEFLSFNGLQKEISMTPSDSLQNYLKHIVTDVAIKSP